MRVLLTIAAAVAFTVGVVNAETPKDDGFYIVRKDDPRKSVDLSALNGEDVQIVGPWHNGRTVLYETLTAPTKQEVRYYLAKSRKTWEESQTASPKESSSADVKVGASVDALDEVNAMRSRRGLPPFIRDAGLSIGAAKCAEYLASIRSSDHTANDFAFLPSGCSAQAGGLGVASPGDGWHSCCAEEIWSHAGAAYAIGSDGRRYMYLFVRGGETFQGYPSRGRLRLFYR